MSGYIPDWESDNRMTTYLNNRDAFAVYCECCRRELPEEMKHKELGEYICPDCKKGDEV